MGFISYIEAKLKKTDLSTGRHTPRNSKYVYGEAIPIQNLKLILPIDLLSFPNFLIELDSKSKTDSLKFSKTLESIVPLLWLLRIYSNCFMFVIKFLKNKLFPIPLPLDLTNMLKPGINYENREGVKSLFSSPEELLSFTKVNGISYLKSIEELLFL